MNILTIPLIAIGYIARAMFLTYIAVRFVLAWVVVFVCFFGLFWLLWDVSGSPVMPALIYAPFIVAGAVLWWRDS